MVVTVGVFPGSYPAVETAVAVYATALDLQGGVVDAGRPEHLLDSPLGGLYLHQGLIIHQYVG